MNALFEAIDESGHLVASNLKDVMLDSEGFSKIGDDVSINHQRYSILDMSVRMYTHSDDLQVRIIVRAI